MAVRKRIHFLDGMRGWGYTEMERSSSIGLFLCFVLALGALLYLGYYAYNLGGGLHVEEGHNIQDDLNRAEHWSDIRR